MRPSRERRAIDCALRCYSARWRRRHGEDAAMLAAALLDDGVAWWSLAASYLGGAVRERVVRRLSRRVSTTVVALVVGVAAVPLALLTSLTPASASSTNVVIVISNPADAAGQLKAAFSSHHFRLTLSERAVPARLIGSILSVSTYARSGARDRVVSEVRGACADGARGCTRGLVLPRHFSGVAHVTIGHAAT
ncbi:MAG: hypothetical protein WCF63_02080 [Acidimicrobiales bacterium]